MRRSLVLTLCLVAHACGSSGGPAPEPANEIAPAVEPSVAPAPELIAEPEDPALASWHFLRKKYDKDGDRRIASSEYPRSAASFARLDADKDGLVSAADFEAKWDGMPRVAFDEKTGGKFQYGVGGPEVGDPAPEFELRSTNGERISLAALRAKRPVVLVFGSFT